MHQHNTVSVTNPNVGCQYQPLKLYRSNLKHLQTIGLEAPHDGLLHHMKPKRPTLRTAGGSGPLGSEGSSTASAGRDGGAVLAKRRRKGPNRSVLNLSSAKGKGILQT